MHLHRSTVQTNNFNIYLDDPFCLQGCKDAFQHTVFTPSVHARIDCMPVSVGFRQCSPLAAVFRNIQYRVDHLEIGDTDISSLDRKVFFNPLVLLKRDFHGFIIPQSGRFVKNLCEQTLNWCGKVSATHNWHSLSLSISEVLARLLSRSRVTP